MKILSNGARILNKVTNLFTDPNDLSTGNWPTSGTPTVTSSAFTFDGGGTQRIQQNWIAVLTAENTYMVLLRIKAADLLTVGASSKYPLLQISYLPEGGSFEPWPDDPDAATQWVPTFRTSYTNHMMRLVMPSDDRLLLRITDHPNQTGATQFDYDFVGLYDVTDLTGLIYDEDNIQICDLDKRIAVWGDSIPKDLHMELCDIYGAFYRHDGQNGGDLSNETLALVQEASAEVLSYNTVVWTGHNNVSADPEQVKADIAAITALLTGQFVVMTLVYSESTAASPTNTDDVNSWIASTYPNNYVDVHDATLLGNMGDGSGQDNTDIALGLTPTSAREDNIHLNAKGKSWIVDEILSVMGQWVH